MPLLTEKSDDSFLQECLKERADTLSGLEKQEVPGDAGSIHPEYLTKLIDKYASEDAILTGDCGSAMVWVLRHFKANGKRRTLLSLRHGTMANAMPMALGLKKAFPNRQVISLSGDGGLSMLMGDLLTIRQENLPIKIVVLHNSSLNFVELEMKTEGLLNSYTDLHNPSFAAVAQAVGIKGYEVKDPADLEKTVQEFLADPEPGLLDVYTNRYELVMPPTVTVKNVTGMATYMAKGVLSGRFKEVGDLMKNAVKSVL